MLHRFVLPLALLIAPPAVAQTAVSAPDNAEIQALFVADQAARKAFKPGQIPDRAAAEKMTADDRVRREAARKLLDDGALRTGADFHAAAFLFQHGSTADDYLLAHSLAVAAVAKGKPEASWIAAATLDRYLQRIGQPQIYGTQFIVTKQEGASMGAYNSALVPDTLRAALNVPDRAAQAVRLEAMQKLAPPPAK